MIRFAIALELDDGIADHGRDSIVKICALTGAQAVPSVPVHCVEAMTTGG